jgi:uncharacterized membrane protein YoaK (UPF0700 family)
MTRYDRPTRALAACLSALAGYVDATGFLALGGFFVSFMSGNTTRLGVGVANRSGDAAIAAGLIATFLAGVVLASLLGAAMARHRRPVVLFLVALLLALAAGFGALGIVPAVGICMALAMGSENAVFERDGEVTIGLTYMTGTLVKTGQRIAAALRGGDPLGWLPFLTQWAGLAAGAVAGALTWTMLGVGALWFPAAGAALLAIVAHAIGASNEDAYTRTS